MLQPPFLSVSALSPPIIVFLLLIFDFSFFASSSSSSSSSLLLLLFFIVFAADRGGVKPLVPSSPASFLILFLFAIAVVDGGGVARFLLLLLLLPLRPIDSIPSSIVLTTTSPSTPSNHRTIHWSTKLISTHLNHHHHSRPSTKLSLVHLFRLDLKEEARSPRERRTHPFRWSRTGAVIDR